MQRQVRALGAAVLGVVAALVASAPIRAAAPSAEEILARVTAGDAQLSSYAVPVHVDARLHRLIGMRFGLNGKVYFKRPDRVALEMRMVPEQYRRLFGELGTPLTWASAYDMSVVSSDAASGRLVYHVRGVPKRPGEIDHMLLDVAADPGVPLHARFLCRDGTAIDMAIERETFGSYELPKRVVADMTSGGWKIHAVLDYGNYELNEAVADSVFVAAGPTR
jgi:hypothetical protein